MQHTTALLFLLPAALATVFRVDVGKTGLVFSPNRVTAFPGDIVEFHYYPKNHSVTQSSFAAPCVALPNGVNSGFNPVGASADPSGIQRFQVTVNDTKPIWLFCEQGTHCASGMSMVINEPPTRNTLDAYQAAAKNAATVINPIAPQGGVFSPSDLANSTSSHAPWSTYAYTYDSYATTASGGATTTVFLVETVTATGLPAASSGSPSSSASSSASTTSSGLGPSTASNAAVQFGVTGWSIVAGAMAAMFGGLII